MMARSARSNQRPDTLMRDRTAGSTKTSCTARPDHTFGSDSESLAASKSSPLVLKQPTYAMIPQKDRIGPEHEVAALQPAAREQEPRGR